MTTTQPSPSVLVDAPTATIRTSDDLTEFAAAVAHHLDGDWRIDTTNPTADTCVVLDGPHPSDARTRTRLLLSVETWRKGAGEKVTIRGSYRHTGATPWRGGVSGETRVDHITVTAKRPAAAIAADVRRRILPHVHDITSDMVALNQARQDERARIERTCAQLSNAVRDAFELHVPHGGPAGDTSRRWISPANPSTTCRGELDIASGKLVLEGLSTPQLETLLTLAALTVTTV